MNDEQLWIQAMTDIQTEVYSLACRRFRFLKEHNTSLHINMGAMKEFAKKHLMDNLTGDYAGEMRYKKIECVRDIRTKYGIGLKEAKDIMDVCVEELGANLYPKP